MGRLVHTHSTYIEGLIELLKKISKEKSILTITPGVISRARSNSNKFTIKITREVQGGHRAIARKGRTIQEIYILSNLSKEGLKAIINKYI